MTGADRVGEFGAISPPALRRIRNLWLDREPLVADTGYDDLVDPTELHVELTNGLGDADSSRLNVQWSELGNYSFHYVDSTEVNWRFDRHPNTHSPETHFHPPPDASTAAAEPSCIHVEEVSLVTHSVVAMWRAAYESGDCGRLNSMSNPP
ncbi:hypothetical protein BRC90_10170 [Halobacteriales archaeon QS_4_69_34]|nr:MAG: hypothetical protein BRC90_10170 [Halobacteriales archaeon QS_4_69_34]